MVTVQHGAPGSIFAVKPRVTSRGFRMSLQFEYLDVAFPQRMVAKQFTHVDAFVVNHTARMLLFNCRLQQFQVMNLVLFFGHKMATGYGVPANEMPWVYSMFLEN